MIIALDLNVRNFCHATIFSYAQNNGFETVYELRNLKFEIFDYRQFVYVGCVHFLRYIHLHF